MLFKITFEVDNGISYTEDTAIVNALDVDIAELMLRRFINAIDSETCISKIRSIEPFKGTVFTGKHGCEE